MRAFRVKMRVFALFVKSLKFLRIVHIRQALEVVECAGNREPYRRESSTGVKLRKYWRAR